MAAHLPIRSDHSLREHNTFGIAARAQCFLEVVAADMLLKINGDDDLRALPRLILGGGSNILLTGDFPGLVLHMAMKGMAAVGEDEETVYVRAAAGENWHAFVQWTLAQGYGGLENLSLIPGSVGAAPIQNIGAYGAEIKDVLHAVTVFDFTTGVTSNLDNAACEFAYRDSVFKRRLHGKVAILDVTFALPKRWQANLRYADVAQELAAHQIAAPTPQQVSDAVIAIRTRKLPDPLAIGNAGSFFKNPVVSAAVRNTLLAQYPALPAYAQPDGSVKLAAGWLIDQCGWKGRRVGAAGVYEKQALVLVNHGGASGEDIARLARQIQDDVLARFGVQLEPEPVFI
ncbi:MAG: UDP-N-acetylmuramate dehydrogenase [Proteobacteria bacterium]|nr:UDP-N-acetylmuramate dehydrogenase [Pseudomonadota bacterium]